MSSVGFCSASVAICALAGVACSGGSVHVDIDDDDLPGPIVEEQRDVGDFTALSAAVPAIVVVRVGETGPVRVIGEDHVLRHIIVERDLLDTGVLRTEGSFRTRAPLTIVVPMPVLEALEASTSAIVDIDGVVDAADLSIASLDSAVVTGEVRADSLTILAENSGVLGISGTADDLELTLDGSASASMCDLTGGSVDAALAGSSSASIRVADSLIAFVTDSASLFFVGDPVQVDIDVRRAASAEHGRCL